MKNQKLIPDPSLVIISKEFNALDSIKNFLLSILREQFFSEKLKNNISTFCKNLLNFSGLEIEGKEISLGIFLIYNHQGMEIDNVVREIFAKKSLLNLSLENDKSKMEKIILNEDNFYVLRDAIRYMRNKGLGWAPGKIGQPLLILKINDNLNVVPVGSAILYSKTKKYTTHDSYLDLTRCYFCENLSAPCKSCNKGTDEKNIAIWLKPNSAIRIYSKGSFRGQIMRTRDTSGWAVREIKSIIRLLSEFIHPELECLKKDETIEKILTVCIHLSEERKGGVIHFIPRQRHLDLISANTLKHFSHDFCGYFNYIQKEIKKHSVFELENDSATIYEELKSNYLKFYDQRQQMGKDALSIDEIDMDELITYTEQDGSLLIDEKGVIHLAGVYFNGPGGRKRITHFISTEFGSVSFLVSEDGGIYFYSNMIPFLDSHFIDADDERLKNMEPDTKFVSSNPELIAYLKMMMSKAVFPEETIYKEESIYQYKYSKYLDIINNNKEKENIVKIQTTEVIENTTKYLMLKEDIQQYLRIDFLKS